MKRAAIIFLMLCLLLTGCTTWMEGSHVSYKPHAQESAQTEPGNVSVSSYRDLLTALEELVERGAEQGVIYVQSFEQSQAESHMETAARNVMSSHPIGAYAVEQIEYEYGTNAGQPALAVRIDYRHNRDEIRRIKQVGDMEGAKAAVEDALKGFDTGLVMRVQSYDSLDFEQMVRDFADRYPEIVMEVPQTVVSLFPETGRDRVVELKFTYQTSRDDLRAMQLRVEPLFDSAELYVSGDGAEHEKFSQLYSFLMERNEYQIKTSITPSYSLLQNGVGDSKAFATVYAAMCRRAGLECMVVSGTRAGEPWFWNMIRDEGNYFHVDLLRCNDLGYFSEESDAQMEGYVWDYSAYPQAGIPEPPDETEPSEPAPTE